MAKRFVRGQRRVSRRPEFHLPQSSRAVAFLAGLLSTFVIYAVWRYPLLSLLAGVAGLFLSLGGMAGAVLSVLLPQKLPAASRWLRRTGLALALASVAALLGLVWLCNSPLPSKGYLLCGALAGLACSLLGAGALLAGLCLGKNG